MSAYCPHCAGTVLAYISRLERKILVNQQETLDLLNSVQATVDKIGVESTATLQHVTDLEAALANQGANSPEVDAALAKLKASTQAIDDLVPDVAAAASSNTGAEGSST